MACEVACAAVAGMAGRVVAFPADTIKVVASVSENGGAQGFVSAARSVLRSDGVAGFYRGIGISLAASAPGVALYISSYEFSKQRSGEALPPVVRYLGCGLFAEAVSCVVWVPMDIVKERLQSQHRDVVGRYRSSWHGVATLWRLEGLRGMYRGYFSTLASFGPFSAVYFAGLEAARSRVDAAASPIAAAPPGVRTAVAAACANVLACVVTNPLEVAKTRYQVHRAVLEGPGGPQVTPQFRRSARSMTHALVDAVRTEGALAVWRRGLLARILFQTPSTAITFGCHEALKLRFCE
jgi:hypothetical protein